MTAGTIFDRTRTPLTVWFTACWLFATQKDGVSAQSLQRALDIGSYQTAWAMLHRLRSVLVRPGRDLLSGSVEVDPHARQHCTELMAQEFGDHPDAAARRMRWARRLAA